jgi:nucleoside-diphosphate-sugar epimerase
MRTGSAPRRPRSIDAMNSTPRKPLCAITGAGGYVGGCIKRYFQEHGWDVLELTRQPATASRAVPFQLGADLSPLALKGVQALVHCAYDFRALGWTEIRAINVEGSRKLFEAARAAGVERLVCISSISAYEGCKSLYGRAKLEIERLALAAGALTIRPGLVYGDQPQAMFGKLVSQVRKSRVLPVFSGGAQIQYLVHSDDLAQFIFSHAASIAPAPAKPLTAANEQPWPFSQLLREIGHGLKRAPTLVPVPWRIVWAGLKTAELCGLRLQFRSDSLVSLMHQNPHPDFSGNVAAGLACRPFEISKVRL